MVDFLNMFRRRPAPKRRGFAREQMDIGSLGGRIGNFLRMPLRDKTSVGAAERIDAPPLAPPFAPASPDRTPRQAPAAPTAPAKRPASGTSRAGFLAAHAVEKSFGSRKVVRGVSIYVRRGEAVGL